MLPTGFQLDHRIDGPALYVNGVLVALLTPLDHGRWRVTLGIGFAGKRHEFVDSEATALRYVAAWSRKWEPDIRQSASASRVCGWTATLSHSPTRINGAPLSACHAL